MIIEINKKESVLKRLWAWLRGEMQTVASGEYLHFKGIDNTKRCEKEPGDYLMMVNTDPKGVEGTALCTYQIISITGNQAKLELLEYNIRR